MSVLARNSAFDFGFAGLALSRLGAFCTAALEVIHEALEMRRKAFKQYGQFES